MKANKLYSVVQSTLGLNYPKTDVSCCGRGQMGTFWSRNAAIHLPQLGISAVVPQTTCTSYSPAGSGHEQTPTCPHPSPLRA